VPARRLALIFETLVVASKFKRGRFYSGTSGLQVPLPKYKFPEAHRDSSRLTYYATLFNSIEINSSFYKLPREKTILNWATQVPEDFRFTFKLWKEITHTKDLNFKIDDVGNFMRAIDSAGERKGCLLIQFAPSFAAVYMPQLRALLTSIKKADPKNSWHPAIEFRNWSWYRNELYDLLEDYGAALVVHDLPKSRPPHFEHRSKIVYLRFHGPTGNYRDSYSESFLYEYAGYINEWLGEGKTVYAYFNNTMGDAIGNLQTLNRFVSE
jgi:uncharacterized protein YecE (DUF72 family)